MIPAIAPFGFLNLFRLTLEIRAGQVIKQHFKLCREQILPALPQMLEQFLFVLQQTIQAAVESVLCRHGEVRPQ